MNQKFVYYPTFDRLFGQNANHFLDNAELTSLRKQVAEPAAPTTVPPERPIRGPT